MSNDPSVHCRVTGCIFLSVNRTARVKVTDDGMLLISNGDHNSPEFYFKIDPTHAPALMEYAMKCGAGEAMKPDNL